MNSTETLVPIEAIESHIHLIRGHRVMLSNDLAGLYGVSPGALVQSVKRNIERFPSDFMFQLTKQEVSNLKSQIVISSWGGMSCMRALRFQKDWMNWRTGTAKISRPSSMRFVRSLPPERRRDAGSDLIWKKGENRTPPVV